MMFLVRVPTQRGGQESWSTYSFGWAFLTVMWALMSRSDSVDQLTLHHLEWQGDCMVITEQATKSDQGGERIFGKHLYANPLNPTVCPILAIAVSIFMRPGTGSMLLFPGTNSKDRFGNLLHVMLEASDSAQKSTLGCEVEDIGLHSTRKGSATMCLGQVAGPSPCQVFIRMNHSLGDLRDRYIFQGEGGDQLCGRMVVGLPFGDVQFAVLPPHFTTSMAARLTDEFWGSILQNYDDYPSGFRSVLPYLLASVLYHEDFLRATLPAGHSLFSCPVFAQNALYPELKAALLLGVGRCNDTHMTATGIPPHLVIAKEIHDLVKVTKEQREEMNELKTLLLTELPSKVADYIRANFDVADHALSLHDLDRRDDALKSFIAEQMAGLKASNQAVLDAHAQAALAQQQQIAQLQQIGDNSWWKTWADAEGSTDVRYTPPDFRFPTGLPAATMWRLWLYGNRALGIRPYRFLRSQQDITKQGTDRGQYSRAKNIMKFIEKVVIDEHFLPENVASVFLLVDAQSDVVFNRVFEYLRGQNFFSKENVREKELSYGTMYNDKCAYEVSSGGRVKRARKVKQ